MLPLDEAGADAPASMRPPLNAGENLPPAFCSLDWRTGFNEAPAERGGKHAKLFGLKAGSKVLQ